MASQILSFLCFQIFLTNLLHATFRPRFPADFQYNNYLSTYFRDIYCHPVNELDCIKFLNLNYHLGYVLFKQSIQ